MGWKKLLESLKNLLSDGESFPDISTIFLRMERYHALYTDMMVITRKARLIHMIYELVFDIGTAASGTSSF